MLIIICIPYMLLNYAHTHTYPVFFVTSEKLLVCACVMLPHTSRRSIFLVIFNHLNKNVHYSGEMPARCNSTHVPLREGS